jgi:hypothetical protein
VCLENRQAAHPCLLHISHLRLEFLCTLYAAALSQTSSSVLCLYSKLSGALEFQREASAFLLIIEALKRRGLL